MELPKKCDCKHCEYYASDYDYILQHNPKWLTVSPPPSCEEPLKDYKKWLQYFEKLQQCSDRMIAVCEFSDDYRMHFHILYNCTDKIKSYKLYNKYKISYICKIYNGGPEKGLHYLFKNISEAEDLLQGTTPIFTIKTLYTNKHMRKTLKKNKQVDHQVKKSICDYWK